MRIALVQTACLWGNVEGNLQRSQRHISTSARRGAELVVFPEMSVHGLWKDHLVRLAAEPLDGPIVSQMARMAREHHVAVGFGMAEKTTHKPFNTYVLLDQRGRRVGVYRKNYVTPLEEAFFRKDKRRGVFCLGGLRVGVAICADNCHEELLRSYARRGAKLVLMPHAWDADPILNNGRVAAFRNAEHMVSFYAAGRIKRHRTHNEMLEAFSRRIAPICRKLGIAGAFVNQMGQPHPLIPFVGPSFALDASGRMIAQTRSKREGILIADFDGLAM